MNGSFKHICISEEPGFCLMKVPDKKGVEKKRDPLELTRLAILLSGRFRVAPRLANFRKKIKKCQGSGYE